MLRHAVFKEMQSEVQTVCSLLGAAVHCVCVCSFRRAISFGTRVKHRRPAIRRAQWCAVHWWENSIFQCLSYKGISLPCVILVFGQSGLKISGVTSISANFTVSFSFISHSPRDQSAAVMGLNCIADEYPLVYNKPIGKIGTTEIQQADKRFFSLS